MCVCGVVEGIKIEKMHRKLARQAHLKDFDSYVAAVLQRTSVTGR